MDARRRNRHRGTFQSEQSWEMGDKEKRKRRGSTDVERVNQLFPNESFLPENQIVADALLHEYIPVVRNSFPSFASHFLLLIYINSHTNVNLFSSILILHKPLRTTVKTLMIANSPPNTFSLPPQRPRFTPFPSNHIFILSPVS